MMHDPHLYESWLRQCRDSTSRKLSTDRMWQKHDNVYYRLDDIPEIFGMTLFSSQRGEWYSGAALLEYELS